MAAVHGGRRVAFSDDTKQRQQHTAVTFVCRSGTTGSELAARAGMRSLSHIVADVSIGSFFLTLRDDETSLYCVLSGPPSVISRTCYVPVWQCLSETSYSMKTLPGTEGIDVQCIGTIRPHASGSEPVVAEFTCHGWR